MDEQAARGNALATASDASGVIPEHWRRRAPTTLRPMHAQRQRRRMSSKTRAGGIGAKLGVYDDVFLCLSSGA